MARWLITIMAIILGHVAAWAGPLDDPLDEGAVRAHVAEQFAAQPGVAGVDITGPQDLSIRMEDGATQSAYLGNLMRELRGATPGERILIVRRFVTAIDRLGGDDALNLANLRLSVYPAAYFDDVRAAALASENAGDVADFMPLRRALGGEMWVAVVEDTPQAVALISPDRLNRAGIDVDTAWRHAEENTRAMLGDVKLHDHEWVLSLEIDGYYENAVLALPEFWDRLAGETGAPLLVASPARGIVLVTLDGDAETLSALRDVVREMYDTRPRPLTTQILRRADGRWSVR